MQPIVANQQMVQNTRCYYRACVTAFDSDIRVATDLQFFQSNDPAEDAAGSLVIVTLNLFICSCECITFQLLTHDYAFPRNLCIYIRDKNKHGEQIL